MTHLRACGPLALWASSSGTIERGPVLLVVLVLAALLPACGGTTFDGSVYRSGPVAFRVAPVPPTWRRIEVSDASLAFRDDAHAASILVNGRCGHADMNTPLAALTNHLLIGTTERDVLLEETIPFDGREARHTILRAKLDGVLMQYDIYVMKKDGCTYDFVYVAEPSRFAAGAPAFERFVQGFHTLPEAGAK